MLKKILSIVMLMLLPAITLVSCGNDDDEPNGSDNDSNSNWVKVGATKFSTKYSYVVLRDEGDEYDDVDDGYSIVCSDTDLSDYLKGKPFKKTISYIEFMYEENVGTSPMFGIYGGYKIIFDSYSEDGGGYDKNGFTFVWKKDEPVCNPSGSSFKEYTSGDTYYFEGQSLKAAAGTYDTDDNFDGDYVDFSLSVKATPSLISDTRSSQFEVVTDPDQIARLKKLISK